MKYVLIFLMVMSCGADVHAQGVPVFNYNEIIVKDPEGKVYKPEAWQALLNTGKYELSVTQDGKYGFIRKYTEAEYNAKIAALGKPAASPYFTTGEKIAPFAAKDIKGTNYDLATLTGKVVVLNFWFVNCPPCRAEIPSLNEMMDVYSNRKDVVFLAVALDAKAAIEQFTASHPFNYNIIETGGYIAQKYGVGNYPTHVVIDKQGKVVFHTMGLSMATVPWVKKSIDEALGKG